MWFHDLMAANQPSFTLCEIQLLVTVKKRRFTNNAQYLTSSCYRNYSAVKNCSGLWLMPPLRHSSWEVKTQQLPATSVGSPPFAQPLGQEPGVGDLRQRPRLQRLDQAAQVTGSTRVSTLGSTQEQSQGRPLSWLTHGVTHDSPVTHQWFIKAWLQ